jgi:PTH1 family peptidyl-tRNA hydrolase
MRRLSRLFEKFRPAPAKHDDGGAGQSEIRWAVIGLGNPGDQYHHSRHNLGFMALRRLAARLDTELTRRKFNAVYGEINTDAGRALVAMPQTFYNRSGECARGLLGYYRIPPERLIVVHDEMDLPLRQIRLKLGGGDAGNRGVRSIAEALGTPNFIRVRIGVAHPEGGQGSIDHVLQPLTNDELRLLDPVVDRAADAVLAIMREGLDRARGVYNQRI